MGFDRGMRVLAVGFIVVLLMGLVGCAAPAADSQSSQKAATGQTSSMKKDPGSSGSMSGMTSQAKSSSDAQSCATCGGKGKAPMVDGTVIDENGVQVVKVGVKNGFYDPNVFTVKADVPIKVVFSGKATGCLANPTFKSLGKDVSFEKTGTGTIDLGPLQPGTYEFSCAMGMTGGKIVVK